MDITYLGHSSFKLRGKSASLVTDPFDPVMVGLRFPAVEADIVTVSHDHKDHSQADLVKGFKKLISGPGEYEVLGVSILGYPSFHDSEGGAKRGKNIIYVFEFDGLRMAHLGDLGQGLSEEKIAQIGDIDVLFIPVGGEVTIGAKEAVNIASEIDPYFIIPMHYQVPGLNKEIFSNLAPVDLFLSECGLSVEKMDKFSIKKEEIIDDQSVKVIVLEKK